MDQAPGPIIDKLAPNAASTSVIAELLPLKKTQSSTAATTNPAIGVQKPRRRHNPPAEAMYCGSAVKCPDPNEISVFAK